MAKTARSQSKACPRTSRVLDGRPCIKPVYDGTLVARVIHGSLCAINSQHRQCGVWDNRNVFPLPETRWKKELYGRHRQDQTPDTVTQAIGALDGARSLRRRLHAVATLLWTAHTECTFSPPLPRRLIAAPAACTVRINCAETLAAG